MKCRKCKRTTKQVCRLSDIGFFEIDLTFRLLKKFPRKAKRISKKHLMDLIKWQHIRAADPHLKHVNKKVPIIVGQTDKFYFILDGNHRALWHFINNKPVYAFILSEFETGKIFREKPLKGHRYVS